MDNLDHAILEIQLDVNVDGNRAWLSKRQEIKYLTTRFDVRRFATIDILLCGHGYETMTVNVNGRRHLASTTQEG